VTQGTERNTAFSPQALLAEPLRRRLFLFVAAASKGVDRDQAAESLGVTRAVAAFHLDKLADAGVLEVQYRRPPGRSGPGAGRPTKRYRAARKEFLFAVPERHYETVAAVLARAVADAAQSDSVAEAVRAAAREYGHAIGESSKTSNGTPQHDNVERIGAVLRSHGYDPCRREGQLYLKNCPFHGLVQDHRDLICRLNLRMLKGVLKGAGATNLVARHDPAAEGCCVTIKRR
jgi:predicted ArsR family transcriptional regulator